MQRNRQETRCARPCSRRSMQIRPVEQPLGEATLEHTVMPPKDKVELSPELARAAIPLTSLACEAEPPKTLITLPNKGELTPVPLEADVPDNTSRPGTQGAGSNSSKRA